MSESSEPANTQIGLVGVKSVTAKTLAEAFPSEGLRMVCQSPVQRPFTAKSIYFQQFVTAIDSQTEPQLVAASSRHAEDLVLVAVFANDENANKAFHDFLATHRSGNERGVQCSKVNGADLPPIVIPGGAPIVLDFLVQPPILKLGALGHWDLTFPVSYEVTVAAQISGTLKR